MDLNNEIEANIPIKDSIDVTFFEYWDQLPTIKEFTVKEYEMIDQDIRDAIVRSLALGKKDIHPLSNEPTIRHVLSANEIYSILGDIIPERIDPDNPDQRKLEPANLYFHLDKLKSSGFIQEVCIVRTGKRFTTYYGRTAKIAVLKYDKSEKMKDIQPIDEISEGLVKLIQRISSNVNSEHIRQILQTINMKNQYEVCEFTDWVKANEDAFKGIEVDSKQLHNLFMFVSTIQPEIIEAIEELAQIMKIW